MKWHEAYFEQARSDHEIFMKLNDPSVEDCHRLHYLQMTTEKLSKALMSNFSNQNTAPIKTHKSVVKMLKVIKQRPEISRQLRYRNHASFSSYINGLLPFAEQVERLAPALAMDQENPEYPWQYLHSSDVIAPSKHSFKVFDPKSSKVGQFTNLLRSLLKISL